MTIPVNCANTVFCGNGTVDPGTNEQCDPPVPGFCDAQCQLVPEKCGDGFKQPPEQCDDGAQNGLDGICAADCTLAPVVCGDMHVTGMEQCDPPNLTTCTTATCCNANCQLQTFDKNPACQACESKIYTTQPAKNDCVKALYSNTTGFACNSFTAAADIAACNALRDCLLSTHCAAGDDVTPCYCGSRNATDCASMGPDTNPATQGACLAKYNAVTLPADKKVTDVFTAASSPIGVANNLVTCDIDAACTTCGP
jgi:cysteine-rich repeat protein